MNNQGNGAPVEATKAVRRTIRFRTPPSSRNELTDREQQVLRWLAHGKTLAVIAVILEISKKTVETHRDNLMRKLGVFDRASATLEAVRLGLISCPCPRCRESAVAA
jgi:DNA-binding NarL/FixJ family response regulator